MRTFLVALLWGSLGLAGALRAETLYFIHVDHLGTPRLAIGEDGVERWRWDQLEPFGDNVPIETMGTEGYPINLPLRFPGQYADKETGLAYNMARDYDSGLGRYIESDPIGIDGGINTYSYVRNRPLENVDPLGLVDWKGFFGGGGAIAGVGGAIFGFDLTSECKCNRRVRIQGFASALAGGFGAKFAKNLSASGSSAEFYDYAECPDPGIANGLFSMASANFVIGVGPGYSRVELGGLRSYDNLGDKNYGLDVSIGLYLGASAVTHATVECCP